MNGDIYDDIALEEMARERFGMSFEVDKVIVRNIDVNRTAKATVFLTKKKQLLTFVAGPSKLTLGEVTKILTRMGLKAEIYIPPKGQPNYFEDIALQKFKTVYPGRSFTSTEDLRYYKTLAPYYPALVLISEIVRGEIKQYDSDVHGKWRIATKFAYRRIKTS